MEMLKLKTQASPSIEVSALENLANNKRPILMAHGAAIGSWDFEEYFMPYFFEQGYNVYALNWRGYGSSELDKEYHEVNLEDCVTDLRRVVELIKSRTEKEPIIMGHSQGGAVTQMYMKKYDLETAIFLGMADFAFLMPALIQFGISIKPEIAKKVENDDFAWLSDDKDFTYAFMFGEETNPKMKHWVHMFLKQGTAASTINDIMTTHKVGEAIGNPKVFIVSGSKDPAASPQSIESGKKAYNAENLVIEGMYHGVQTSKDWQKAADGIINWLEN